jgi:hypothetical protein
MTLDLAAPPRRTRTQRQQIIDMLSKSIAEGSFGPLRLIEQDDDLYVTGCGLMRRVESIEEAHDVVEELTRELREILCGLDIDLSLQICRSEINDSAKAPRADENDAGFSEFLDPIMTEDVQWREWSEPDETPAPPTENDPAGETLEPALARQTAVVEAAPPPTEPEPPAEAIPGPVAEEPLPVMRPPVVVRIDQVDATLDDIVSSMLACCPAA